jgi:hypothetical protein
MYIKQRETTVFLFKPYEKKQKHKISIASCLLIEKYFYSDYQTGFYSVHGSYVSINKKGLKK